MCRTITTTKFCEIIVFKPCLFMVREMYHLLFEMTLQKFFKLLRPLQQMMIVIRGFFIRELIGEKSTKSLLSPKSLERVVPYLVISFDLGLNFLVMSCHFSTWNLEKWPNNEQVFECFIWRRQKLIFSFMFRNEIAVMSFPCVN